MDVGLDDEMTKLRGDDAVGRRSRSWDLGFLSTGWFRVGVGVGFGRIGFPFFENGAELGFTADESDPLAAVAHAWFQDPPFLAFGWARGVSGETVVQFVRLNQSFIEEFGVVELEIQGLLYVVSEKVRWVFRAPGRDCVGEIVFADEGFADDVGIREGC